MILANSDDDCDSILSPHLQFDTVDDDSGYDSEESEKVGWREKPKTSMSVIFGPQS